MDINHPCSLDNLDYILPLNASDTVVVGVISNDKNEDELFCCASDNMWSYVFIGDSEEDLHESIAEILPDSLPVRTTEVTVYELLGKWRSVIYKKELRLLAGCQDRFAHTALAFPEGFIYPSAYQFLVVVELNDDSSKEYYEKDGSIIAGSSHHELIAQLHKIDDSLMYKAISGPYKIVVKALLHLSKANNLITVDTTICNAMTSLASCKHVRQLQESENN